MFEAFSNGWFPATKGNPSGLCLMRYFDVYYHSDATVFATQGAHRIGRIYDKVLYREYEDTSFSKEKPHPKYLGFLGPILKGEIGDTILVHFRNNGGQEYSMHPHGVFYGKDSEGALYEDNTKGTLRRMIRFPRGALTCTLGISPRVMPQQIKKTSASVGFITRMWYHLKT